MPIAPTAEERQLLDEEESLLIKRHGCEQQLKIHERALAALDKRIAGVKKQRAALERKREFGTVSHRRDPEHRKGVIGLDVPLGIGGSESTETDETLSARTPSPNPPTPPPKSPSKTVKAPLAGSAQVEAVAEITSQICPTPADTSMDTDVGTTYAATTRSEPGDLAAITDIDPAIQTELGERISGKVLKDDEIDSKEITPVKDSWNSLHGKKLKAVEIVAALEPIRDPKLRVQPLQPQRKENISIPTIRVSRASLVTRKSVLARRNALMENIDRVRGVLSLSLSLHLKFDKLSSLEKSLTIETIDWPVLIPEMQFYNILQGYFAANCLSYNDNDSANETINCNNPNTFNNPHDVNADDNVFTSNICENCQKCQLYSTISNIIHQFIDVVFMSQYSIFDLLECWSAAIDARRNGDGTLGGSQSSNGSGNIDGKSGAGEKMGSGGSNGGGSHLENAVGAGAMDDVGSKVEESDWVSFYVCVDHQQRVREIAEIIVECIETSIPFYDPRDVRISQLSRISRLSRFSKFGTTRRQAQNQSQGSAPARI